MAKSSNLPSQKPRDSRAKHGLWIDFKAVKLDGRTALAKAIKFMRSELVKHVGGTPSIAEAIIIERAVHKAVKAHIYETNSFSDGDQGSKDHYLALVNSLRLDLQALGMKAKAIEKTLDLNSYIQEKYGEGEKKE